MFVCIVWHQLSSFGTSCPFILEWSANLAYYLILMGDNMVQMEMCKTWVGKFVSASILNQLWVEVVKGGISNHFSLLYFHSFDKNCDGRFKFGIGNWLRFGESSYVTSSHHSSGMNFPHTTFVLHCRLQRILHIKGHLHIMLCNIPVLP